MQFKAYPHINKKIQWSYKPGYVVGCYLRRIRNLTILLVIYLSLPLPANFSSLPLGNGRVALKADIHDLTTHKVCGIEYCYPTR